MSAPLATHKYVIYRQAAKYYVHSYRTQLGTRHSGCDMPDGLVFFSCSSRSSDFIFFVPFVLTHAQRHIVSIPFLTQLLFHLGMLSCHGRPHVCTTSLKLGISHRPYFVACNQSPRLNIAHRGYWQQCILFIYRFTSETAT